jgi:hypothetical protein
MKGGGAAGGGLGSQGGLTGSHSSEQTVGSVPKDWAWSTF